MLYTQMHKKIQVADVEIDPETANILSIPKLHNIERIPIGIEVKNLDEEFREIYKPSRYMDEMRVEMLRQMG